MVLLYGPLLPLRSTLLLLTTGQLVLNRSGVAGTIFAPAQHNASRAVALGPIHPWSCTSKNTRKTEGRITDNLGIARPGICMMGGRIQATIRSAASCHGRQGGRN